MHSLLLKVTVRVWKYGSGLFDSDSAYYRHTLVRVCTVISIGIEDAAYVALVVNSRNRVTCYTRRRHTRCYPMDLRLSSILHGLP